MMIHGQARLVIPKVKVVLLIHVKAAHEKMELFILWD